MLTCDPLKIFRVDLAKSGIQLWLALFRNVLVSGVFCHLHLIQNLCDESTLTLSLKRGSFNAAASLSVNCQKNNLYNRVLLTGAHVVVALFLPRFFCDQPRFNYLCRDRITARVFFAHQRK